MRLEAGDAAPFFQGATLNGNANFLFDTAAGCPIVLLFIGKASWPQSAAALALLARHNALFDDRRARFFGVTVDPDDVAQKRIAKRVPGIRWFLDYDAAISGRYGLIEGMERGHRLTPGWFLLDAGLRIVRRADIGDGASIFAELEAMIARGVEQIDAPVLMVPRVFEPDLCHELIGRYERDGGTRSGFMREENGLTVAKYDESYKRRADYNIEDQALRSVLRQRLVRRLLPQIEKAFGFRATRIERWMVACYDGASQGFFSAHRDNTTAGTAHRRFACTINLNAEEYDGGELRFPEFGTRTYRAPTGGAVIFSCSLLHEAMPVTRGKRYAFLPFFYDDAGAQLRERNQVHMQEGNGTYRMDPTSPSAAGDAGRTAAQSP